VVDDPVAEHTVFFAGGWQHRHEPAAVGVDVGDVVGGVAIDDPMRDRHGPVCGDGQDEHQLLEVRSVVFVVAADDC